MGTSTSGEVATARGGLRALVARLASLERAAPGAVRMGGFATVVLALGALGHWVGAPASASTTAPATSTPVTPVVPVTPNALPSTSSSTITPSAWLAAAVDAAAPPLAPPPLEITAGGPVDDGDVIDINAATELDLRRLPTIGPRRARAIVELRTKLGGFRRVEELARVRGIGRGAIKRLRARIRIGPWPVVAPTPSAEATARPP